MYAYTGAWGGPFYASAVGNGRMPDGSIGSRTYIRELGTLDEADIPELTPAHIRGRGLSQITFFNFRDVFSKNNMKQLLERL